MSSSEKTSKEFKGYWWRPSDPQRRVAGILYYIPGDTIRLELIGTLDTEGQDSIAAILHTKNEDVLHGESSDGDKISIFDCGCGISHRGNASFSTAEYKARVIAIGAHLSSIDERVFVKAVVKIPELSYWLLPNMIHRESMEGDNVHLIMPKLNKEEREVAKTNLNNGFSISLCRNASFNSGDFYFTPHFQQYTTLVVESMRSRSLKEYYEKVVRFERFLSLATLREVGYSELILNPKDSSCQKRVVNNRPSRVIVDTVFHQKPGSNKIEKYRFLFDYDRISVNYQNAIKKWYSKDKNFDAILGRFLDTIDYHGPFSYISFLVVIQAVEGYGRRFLYKEIEEYRNALPEKKKWASLHDILSTVFKHYSNVKCINQKTNLDAIVDSRHYQSHLLRRKGKNTADIIELYGLADELRRVLVCCMLSYIGFTNEEINSITESSYNDLFNQNEIEE